MCGTNPYLFDFWANPDAHLLILKKLHVQISTVIGSKVDRERYCTYANVNKVRGWDHGGAQSQG